MMAFNNKPEPGDLLPLSDTRLQDAEAILVTDSNTVEDTCELLGISAEGVTGLVVWIGEGEYLEAWSTKYAAPWALDSLYQCVKGRA